MSERRKMALEDVFPEMYEMNIEEVKRMTPLEL